MSSFLAGLVAVGVPAVFIAIVRLVTSRRSTTARYQGIERPRIPFGWRLAGGFAPYLFLIGVLSLYVWGRGALGLQHATVFGSWLVLAIGVVLTIGSVVGYFGYLRRLRGARTGMR